MEAEALMVAESAGFLAGMAAMGFWFWAISVFESILFISLVCNKRFFSPVVSLVVLSLVYQFLFKFNVYGYLIHNPLIALGALGVYLISGIPWSFARWMKLVSKRANIYNKIKKVWLKKKNASEVNISSGTIPEDLKDEWMKTFIRYSHHDTPSESVDVDKILTEDEYSRLGLEYGELIYRVSPKAREYKGDIMFWITYWPIDMLWLVFHDLVIDFANTVYTAISGSYQRISDNKFKAANDDFAKKTDNN